MALIRVPATVAPDLLGFGLSAKPRRAYSLVEQADLIDSLVESLGLGAPKPLHILAHDYSVSLAQELLARDLETDSRNSRTSSVIFLNGGLVPETHRALLVQQLAASPYTGWLIKRYRFVSTAMQSLTAALNS